jgi:hypothetical protein
MSIKRITISVPAATAAKIKKAAGARAVSAWVTEVVEGRLRDEELERLWLEFYESVAPRKRDVRRADQMFARLTKPARRRAA